MRRKHTPSLILNSDKTRRLIIYLCLVSSYCVGVRPLIADYLEFFVATTGDPSNQGTESHPFASITHARDHIRGLITGGVQQDIKVVLRGGTYTVTEPILFTSDDTISATHHITYLAYPGEEPIISGGQSITNWKVDGPLWYAELSETNFDGIEFREIFVNGVRKPRAREPDVGFFQVLAAGPDRRTSFQYYAEDLLPYANLSGAEVVYFHDWSTSRVTIDKLEPATQMLFLSDPIGASYAPSTEICFFTPHPRYYIENHLDLLDRPGEWYLDTANKILWYWPMPGETTDTVKVIAPIATSLVEFSGTMDSVKNIHLVGLTFSHCAWNIPDSGYAAYQAGSHEIRPLKTGLDIYRDHIPAALTIRGADNCSVSHCRFLNLGGSAIRVERGAKDITLSGNEVRDVGANGIMVGEMKGAPFSERTVLGEWNYWWYDYPEYLVSNTEVSNNIVEKCGAIFSGCVGIWVGIAETTTVTRNVVRDLPYTGISVGWVWNNMTSPCVGNVIDGNMISDVLQFLSDGAGIYMLGKQEGTVVKNNMIFDVHPSNGSAGNHGLFLDQGTDLILFEDNVVYSIEGNHCVRFNGAPYQNIFKTNTFVPMAGYEAFANAPTEAVFIDNTVSDPTNWVVPDAETLQIGLLPYDADSNGLPDAWENVYLGSTGFLPTLDTDGDGASLLEEYVAGTHPMKNQSVLRIVSKSGGAGFSFTTKKSAGIGYRSSVRRYTVEKSHSIRDFDWTNIQGLISLPATGDNVELSFPSEDRPTFYRVRVTLNEE